MIRPSLQVPHPLSFPVSATLLYAWPPSQGTRYFSPSFQSLRAPLCLLHSKRYFSPSFSSLCLPLFPCFTLQELLPLFSQSLVSFFPLSPFFFPSLSSLCFQIPPLYLATSPVSSPSLFPVSAFKSLFYAWPSSPVTSSTTFSSLCFQISSLH